MRCISFKRLPPELFYPKSMIRKLSFPSVLQRSLYVTLEKTFLQVKISLKKEFGKGRILELIFSLLSGLFRCFVISVCIAKQQKEVGNDAKQWKEDRCKNISLQKRCAHSKGHLCLRRRDGERAATSLHPSRYVYRLRPVRRGMSNPIFRLSFLSALVRYGCGQPGIYQRLRSHRKYLLLRTRNEPRPWRKRKAYQQWEKVQAQQRKVKQKKKLTGCELGQLLLC